MHQRHSTLPSSISAISIPSSIDSSNIQTIEPHLQEAIALTQRLEASLKKPINQRLHRAFVALAGGDSAVGLLAFYLWRRRDRR